MSDTTKKQTTADLMEQAIAKINSLRDVNQALIDALETLVSEEYRDDDDPILHAARVKARAALSKARETA